MGENHKCFLIYQNITFIGSTNFQNSPAPTGRRIQPPIYRLQPEGIYNSLVLSSSNPLFIGSNLKEATTPCILQLQLEGGSNPLVYRLQPEGSYDSLYSPAPIEGGYNPLSLPLPSSLKYKWRLNLSLIINLSLSLIINLSLSLIINLSLSLSYITIIKLNPFT
jgi:hypothetical protein